jgi:hypothetical protein
MNKISFDFILGRAYKNRVSRYMIKQRLESEIDTGARFHRDLDNELELLEML